MRKALQQSAHTEALPFIYNGYGKFPDLKITKHFNRRDFDLLVKWNTCYLISLLFIQHVRTSLQSNSGDCSAEESRVCGKGNHKSFMSLYNLARQIQRICSHFDSSNPVLIQTGHTRVSLHPLRSQHQEGAHPQDKSDYPGPETHFTDVFLQLLV